MWGVINLTATFITSLAILINYLRGIYNVLTIRYLQNFTTPRIVSKIYAMNSISRNFFRIIISLFGSFLLRKTNTANSCIIFGIFLIVISVILILYMKPRLGLRPEQYKTEDIKFK